MKSVLRTALALGACATMFMAAAPAVAHTSAEEKANKALVLRFYDAVVNAKDVTAAESMLGPKYIQHNPSAADGVEGLRGFIAFLRSNAPNSRSEVKRAFVDGDHVILHVRSQRKPEDKPRAIMEIFRVERGKVVEHWDVIQDIPEKAANNNTMF